MTKRRSELTPAQRKASIAVTSVQVALAVAAWTDLAFRDADLVRGRKRWWALAILIKFFGPIAYFHWGRKQLS